MEKSTGTTAKRTIAKRQVFDKEYDSKDIEYVFSNYNKQSAREIATQRGLALAQVNQIVLGLRQQGLQLTCKPNHRQLFREFAERKLNKKK
jgi:hypothetical protein